MLILLEVQIVSAASYTYCAIIGVWSRFLSFKFLFQVMKRGSSERCRSRQCEGARLLTICLFIMGCSTTLPWSTS